MTPTDFRSRKGEEWRVAEDFYNRLKHVRLLRRFANGRCAAAFSSVTHELIADAPDVAVRLATMDCRRVIAHLARNTYGIGRFRKHRRGKR